MGHQTSYRTAQIDGLSIFYREAGPKDGPVLLLLHGLPSSSRMFEPLFARLSGRYHLIAPDYPGFGHSDWPDPKQFAYRFDHIAEIMNHFTEALGLSRYTLYMQDYGGPVGFRMATGVSRISKEFIPMADASNITAPTRFMETKLEKYAYRRFGRGASLPLVCLQHFTGTLDNWDPAVTDPLAQGREVILFESAGLGRSTGEVPDSVPAMAAHALAFMDALGLTEVDLLGYSLGGMVAQQIALNRPSVVRKMLLVGTAPEGGEDIMHMEKPELKKIADDPNLPGLQRLVKLFFTSSESSQAAGQAFVARLAERRQDREPLSGPNVAKAQIAAFRAWERVNGERFGRLRDIGQPCLVVNGVLDNMIPVRNSYMLSEHLPRAMLLTYPDAGHGSLFQFHGSFVKQASLFLDSETF